MHYEPISSNRKKLRADSLSRQKCYAAYLRNLLVAKTASATATNNITMKGAN